MQSGASAHRQLHTCVERDGETVQPHRLVVSSKGPDASLPLWEALTRTDPLLLLVLLLLLLLCLPHASGGTGLLLSREGRSWV